MPERMYQGETVPAGLAWEDVQRLLGTTEGERPADKRDRAVVLLFAVYGLRAGEASGLRLEDIDWEQETLRVRRPKPGRTHRCCARLRSASSATQRPQPEAAMTDTRTLGPWLRRFLAEHLVSERNLAPQHSTQLP